MIREEIKEPGREKYIVYDSKGYVVLVTTDRGLAKIYEKRVSLSNDGKRKV